VLADLKDIVSRFKRLGAKKEHLKVILTFSAQYKPKQVIKFQKALGEKLKDWIDPSNIFPINFVRLDELNPDFKAIYEDLLPVEYDRAIEVLVQDSEPFRPQKMLWETPEMEIRIRALAEGGDKTWASKIKQVWHGEL